MRHSLSTFLQSFPLCRAKLETWKRENVETWKRENEPSQLDQGRNIGNIVKVAAVDDSKRHTFNDIV